MKLRKNEQGFSAVEVLLVLIFVAILAVAGAVVYNANKKKTSDTQHTATSRNDSSQAPASPTAQPTVKYLDITEWGVELPQPKSDTLQYKTPSDVGIQVISKNLSDQYGCTDEGAGMITRWKTGETEDDATGMPFPQAVITIGDYSYGFAHDTDECSDSVPISAQNAANDETKAQLSQLKADS